MFNRRLDLTGDARVNNSYQQIACDLPCTCTVLWPLVTARLRCNGGALDIREHVWHPRTARLI